jgi:hypothetical protein
MYDKKFQRMSNPAIAKVAQQQKFYDAQTEKQLNDQVERPGNLVFKKLIAGHSIDSHERAQAAAYIATMYKRVPKRRDEISNMVPSVAEKVLKDLDAVVKEWAAAHPDREAATRRQKEVETVSVAVRSNPLKGAVTNLIRSPWPSQRIILTISAMTWRIGRVKDASSLFVTSDNPVHFFKGLGIGTPRSELTFPIAQTVALYASWRGQPASILFFDAPSRLVKECNRRIVFDADRFVFSSRRESWVATQAIKAQPFFSEIRW